MNRDPGHETVGSKRPAFLTTERLAFRTWGAADLELAAGLWGHPEVARFVFPGGAPPSRADIEARLAREMSWQEEHRLQYWPIYLRSDGSHVGCCGLRPYRPGMPEFGVHIGPAFWRRGLAREAATAVVAYAFGQLGASAIFAGHHPRNSASRELLVSLGFRYTHDEIYPPTGLMHPSYRLDPLGSRSAAS